MWRTSLCSKCGMLFVFDVPGAQWFWMKNTLIPLDMYFYDSDGTLVDRALNMRPDTEINPPMQYISQKLVRYVVEVAQGSGFYARKLDFNHCNLR